MRLAARYSVHPDQGHPEYRRHLGIRRRWATFDLALAVMLTVPAVVLVLRDHGYDGVGWGLAAAITMWSGSVALRSMAPLAMAVVAAAGIVAFLLVPGVHSDEPFIASLVVFFAVGAQLAGRRFWFAIALLLATGLASNLDDSAGRSTVNLLVTPIVLFGGPIGAGVLLRRSREQAVRLRRLGAELTAERELHALAAAAAERNRIARDLHDLISHSVSAMVVQAGAAEAQLAPDSPARAQVVAVRRTGKETLTELRRQLGVLRETRPA